MNYRTKLATLACAPAITACYFIAPVISSQFSQPTVTITHGPKPSAVGFYINGCRVLHDDADTDAANDTAFWTLYANYNNPVWSYKSGGIIGYSNEEDSIVFDKPDCPTTYNKDVFPNG